MRYNLKESSEHSFGWVLTDTELGIVVTFEEGNFNDSQEMVVLDGIPEQFRGMSATELTKALNGAVSDLVEWLRNNHPELIFTSPKKVKERARQSIGSSIKSLREEYGESQRDLAKAIGIDQGHLARIESGKYSVGIDILAMIADHYKMVLGFFYPDI